MSTIGFVSLILLLCGIAIAVPITFIYKASTSATTWTSTIFFS